MNRYKLQDHVCTEVARIYSNEFKQPFFVAIGEYGLYDLASADNSITVELKAETTSCRTGNVSVEYWNTDFDRPSGILATKANTWLHLAQEGDHFTAFEYDVDRLRKLIIEDGAVMTNGRNSLFKLIPLEAFRKHARREFPFESAFLQKAPPPAVRNDSLQAKPELIGQPQTNKKPE